MGNKIIKYINESENLYTKFTGWVKELYPEIKERAIEREIEKLLIHAFQTNLRILLIVDELSTEQRSTIKNVINSFKLANSDSVQFAGYIIRLVQKINISNNDYEYALTVQ